MNANKENFLYSIGKTNIYKENFLSDITYAKCQSNEEFLYSFFYFCFPKEKSEENAIKLHYIDREKTEKTENSRNDFQFHTTKGTYIVENKINDKDTSKVKKYLPIVKFESSHIAYIVPRQYDKEAIKVLERHHIGYFLWEDYIDNIYRNEKFTEYCIIAASILGYNLPLFKCPSVEDINNKIKICNDFYSYKLETKYSQKGKEEWEANQSYGYYIWASAWFGLAFCPIKGVYFCFAIGLGGDKTFNKKEMYEYLKPLGQYYKDEYYYYEIKEHDILDYSNYKEILTNAFSEFGETIILDNINIPLNKFIEKEKSNN